ncbi:heptaprenylglyceryl phosphate synthase [Microbacterium sp. APC 3898]|uniref:Heptaprenylglyceryl phosphate synthase n=2 Tax=Planococcus TaxID=1372 RepID=A0ABT7ZP38_9BACL|nr:MULTISPECIES: heptaprenylglyceryl phosphate synthase [Terrabacteria group]MBD8016643.1 heptaprenylglyceryl phosphate synthase [Planococcus wigleyi]MBF6633496.1 heptaprenylglyceryl phosphate synthase [Planococcus sp. (in: firmicutes)]MDN3428931.1 heptaprenylglyceryl phosphate synthase [Planococcus sp. APC 4016]MDN3500627.1 heptaprenylglyceryl phosphate synthase [Microbacterium sp. APC 3898]
MDFKTWRHVFKLDPAKEITDGHLERICRSGTDAILIGGSDNVTLDNVLELTERIQIYNLPIVMEVSTIDSVAPGFDYYFIPTVLNSDDPQWIKGFHHQAIKEYGEILEWDEMVAEGYCILNADCKAAKLTGAKTDLSADDVVAYARLAEHFFRLPIFYLEYSGIYGDMELAGKVKEVLDETRMFYGGGIDSADKARAALAAADTIVVGNIIYENIEKAIETVEAVAETAD